MALAVNRDACVCLTSVVSYGDVCSNRPSGRTKYRPQNFNIAIGILVIVYTVAAVLTLLFAATMSRNIITI